MKHYSFYHKDSGVVHPSRFATTREDAVVSNTPLDHIAIEGALDPFSQRVDVQTGQVMDWQPPQPSPDHEWDASKRRWRTSEQAEQRHQRAAAALLGIRDLEASQLRPMRELAIDPSNAEARKRLEAIEAEIASLRGDL